MGGLSQGWERADRRTADEMIAEARKALFVMFGFMAVVWALQVVNWLSDYRLDTDFGVIPRDMGRLPGILVSPFLHFGWDHIEANSGPLFIFGFLAAYRGVVRFVWLTLLVAMTSGLAVWLFQEADTMSVGASGVVFGYFGYVVLRGLFDRRLVDVLIGVVMAASFAYLVTVAVPGTPGVSWLAHLGGLVGGMIGAYLLRDGRRPAPVTGGTPPTALERRGTSPTGLDPRGTSPTAADPRGASPTAVDPSRAELHKELRDLGLL